MPEVEILAPIKAWYISRLVGMATAATDRAVSVDSEGERASSQVCLCLSGMSLLRCLCQCVLAALDVDVHSRQVDSW
jgi:hypothetical protein